jgi:hypothetical protein
MKLSEAVAALRKAHEECVAAGAECQQLATLFRKAQERSAAAWAAERAAEAAVVRAAHEEPVDR